MIKPKYYDLNGKNWQNVKILWRKCSADHGQWWKTHICALICTSVAKHFIVLRIVKMTDTINTCTFSVLVTVRLWQHALMCMHHSQAFLHKDKCVTSIKYECRSTIIW